MSDKIELLIQEDGPLCTLTINREHKRNSLNTGVLIRLSETLHELDKRNDIRVIVLHGRGQKAFCAGFDITEISAGNNSETKGGEHQLLEETFRRLRNISHPVIAMINGVCIGAGLDLALNCDFRIAAEGSRFGMTPAKLGVTYHPAGLNRFIQTVGVNATKELFYTGRIIPAEKAVKLGLVDRIVTGDELEETVFSLAREIAGNAPLSIKCIKYITNRLTDKINLTPEEEETIKTMTLAAFNSEDLAEGQKAFMQKRKPHFKGK